MPSISYPTSLSIPGPWILDAENLKDLDELMDSCWTNMNERRDRMVESALAKWRDQRMQDGATPESIKGPEAARRKEIEKGYPFGTKRRKIVVYLSAGRSADGQSFAELAPLAPVHQDVPRGFDLSFEAADTRVRVQAERNYSGVVGLSIDTSSDDPTFAQELFGKLQNWATEIRPKRWLQKWLELQLFFPIFAMLNLVAIALALVSTFTPRPVVEQGPGPLQRQAWDLLKGGVTSANEPKAIEILLALESDYGAVPVKTARVSPPVRVWIYLGLTLLATMAFGSPPKGAIGLWGGGRLVERQRSWVKFVSVSIPGFVLSYALIPWVVNLLGWSK